MPASIPRPPSTPELPAAVRRSLALQTELEIDDPKFRPMLPVSAVLARLGPKFQIGAPQIQEMWEFGVLIGFDISVAGREARPLKNGSSFKLVRRKIELRILSKSVDFFLANAGAKHHELEWAAVWRLIVPHKKPVLVGKELARTLLCEKGHIENLVLNGRLTPVRKSSSGVNGSWVVTRESFETFLKGRLS